MKNILIFGGTCEGRILSEKLSKNKIEHIVSVATEYGENLLEDSDYATVNTGRMDIRDMENFVTDNDIDIIIDATHPYATEVTKNIRAVTDRLGIEYIRVVREFKTVSGLENSYVKDSKEASSLLKETKGNILLTTGSKELSVFSEDKSIRDRLYVRVIPSSQSFDICMECNIKPDHIIAMQGPFSAELNKALIKEYDIRYLVTKDSGINGGFEEKYIASIECGCNLIIIGRESNEEGLSVEEAFNRICCECEIKSTLELDGSINICLSGIGPGAEAYITKNLCEYIKNSDMIFGAPRILKSLKINNGYPYYLAKDIIPLIVDKYNSHDVGKEFSILILFSGDSGFNSGAKKMVAELKEGMPGLNININVEPGISSVSLFASRIKKDYSDAFLCSIHGKSNDAIETIVGPLNRKQDVFMLLSGAQDVKKLVEFLWLKHLEEVKLVIGYQLSYEDEKIYTYDKALDALKYLDDFSNGLYIAYLSNTCDTSKNTELRINNNTNDGMLKCFKSDDEFIRGNVPMTKEQIRHLSVIKMSLAKNDIIFDIGAGTGSVSVEMALCDKSVRVYSIEKKSEAIELIKDNISKFGIDNVEIIEGDAANVIESLPIPTKAFIGGSSGQLINILESLRALNNRMHIVINAISLQTISLIVEYIKNYSVHNVDIMQIQVTPGQKVGEHYMMKAENPVFICSFDFV